MDLRSELFKVARLCVLGVVVMTMGVVTLAWQHALVSSLIGMVFALFLMIGNLVVITWKLARA